MEYIKEILHGVPFFRHFTNEEIQYFVNISRITSIKKGQSFDLKKNSSFNIILNGFFEIESFGKSEVVFLSPGSFFGNMPFAEINQSGKIRAVVDSNLIIIDENEIYRLFLKSYKGLRGYIKIIEKMGFSISEVASKYFKNKSTILSVFSPSRDYGNSYFTSFLGFSLNANYKVIILDVTLKGNSIFNILEQKLKPPLSQKAEDSPSMEKILSDRITEVDKNLDLLNISYSSKVKVDSEILSPILFVLSKTYEYVILDVSNDDEDLRNRAFSLSDEIFSITKDSSDNSDLFKIFDENLNEGQRVYYVANDFYNVKSKPHEGYGRYLFPGLKKNQEQSEVDIIKEYALENDEFQQLVTRSKIALVSSTGLLDSIAIGGFLNAANELSISFDYHYSSAYSYLINMFYFLSDNMKQFKDLVVNFFSYNRINNFLDVTFPDEYIFKNSNVMKYFTELAGKKRVEYFKNLPSVILTDSNNWKRKIFSTGNIADLMGAAYLMHPMFESKYISGKLYNSGFPFQNPKVEDLYRTNTEKVYYVSVDNSESLSIDDEKVLKFFRNFLDYSHKNYFNIKQNKLAEKNFVIEFSEKRFKPEKIFKLSKEISKKLLKNF